MHAYRRRASHGRRSASGRSRRARPGRRARSATAVDVSAWSMRASSSRVRVSSARVSMPMAPWPTAGRNSSTCMTCVARSRQAEPLQAGERQQRGVDLAVLELAQPRLDIAAQRRHVEVGPQPLGDRLPPQRGGADRGAARQFGERFRLAADEHVARVLALEAGRQHAGPAAKTVGMSLAECTARSMRRSMQRLLDLLGEQALAADLGQRPVLDRVAGGADDHEFDRAPRRRPGRRASRARTMRACASASGLPRVPMRNRAVDCAMEPLDARAPFSSAFPERGVSPSRSFRTRVSAGPGIRMQRPSSRSAAPGMTAIGPATP